MFTSPSVQIIPADTSAKWKKPKLGLGQKFFMLLIYFCLISHIEQRYSRRKIGKKTEDVFGEDQFGFRRGKGTRDTIGILRISE
jgi:hypothetical protein